MPGFNADLYQKYHKIWPTGFAKVAVQSVQAVLLPLSNNSYKELSNRSPFGDCGFLSHQPGRARWAVLAGPSNLHQPGNNTNFIYSFLAIVLYLYYLCE